MCVVIHVEYWLASWAGKYYLVRLHDNLGVVEVVLLLGSEVWWSSSFWRSSVESDSLLYGESLLLGIQFLTRVSHDDVIHVCISTLRKVHVSSPEVSDVAG